MPILVSKIVELLQSSLDAEGSDRYLFDQDYKPAINSAIDATVDTFNAAFAANKLSPEQLRELTKVMVWQASSYSRVAYNEADTGHPLWTVVAVYPKPTCNKIASSGMSATKSTSKFRGDISFIKSDNSAKRLTLEEWNETRLNAFMPGNDLLKNNSLIEYSYLDFADYTSTSYTGNSNLPEIQIRPEIPNQLVAIAYLKTPNRVSVIGDSVEFPPSLTRFIVDVALNYISYKQGDNTTLYMVTAQSIQKLTSLMQ